MSDAQAEGFVRGGAFWNKFLRFMLLKSKLLRTASRTCSSFYTVSVCQKSFYKVSAQCLHLFCEFIKGGAQCGSIKSWHFYYCDLYVFNTFLPLVDAAAGFLN